jgi:hypothetical protein
MRSQFNNWFTVNVQQIKQFLALLLFVPTLKYLGLLGGVNRELPRVSRETLVPWSPIFFKEPAA